MDLLKSFESQARFDRFDQDDVPSIFNDTLAAAFALTRREELSDSSLRAFREQNEKRAATIAKLGGSARLVKDYDLIPEGQRAYLRELAITGELESSPYWRTLSPFKRNAFEHVMAFERRFPDQVPTDQSMWETIKTEAAAAREKEQFTLQRGGGGAAFLGAAGAIFTDPAILFTLPFGATIGTGRALATVGRVAAIEGSIGIGVELPIQAEVFRFKRQLESPWSYRQSAINVLAAGAGGAAIGGTIAGGVVGARSALKNYREFAARTDVSKNPFLSDAELREAEKILADTVALHDENPLRIATDDGDVPLDTPHERAFEDARAQLTDNQPVDVRTTVEGIEPDDGVNQVIRRSEDPAELVSIDPREVTIDAETFQFKSGVDGAGVNDTLRGVTKFDQRLAGVSLIWERADGKQFIVDGHQRAALGVRSIEAGQDPAEVRLNGFILREADGVTAIDARRMAAVKNMAEGSGSALDAAKILRDVGPMGEAMLPPLPPRSALVRQARGLANLGEDEFLQVVNGVIPERYGALVGGATADPKLQQAMIGVLRRTKPANETQARSIVDQVRTAGTEEIITEDLFGAQQITESLYLERAQVLDAALREARKDKAVFGRLLSEEGRITETGQNRLDRAANFERLQEASNATTQISRLANTKGAISEALTEAARQVKAGKKPSDVAQAFLATTRREILAGDRGGREAGGTRPGADAESIKEQLGGLADDLDQLDQGEAPARFGSNFEAVTDDEVPALIAATKKQVEKDITKLRKELGEVEAPLTEGKLKLKKGVPVRLSELTPDESALALAGLLDQQADRTMAQLYAKAEANQKLLAREAKKIVDELGEDVVLSDPGIKKRATSEEKLSRKGFKAGELTDIVRLGFLVRTPEVAAKVIQRLADMFEVLDQGVTVTGMGYVDHKALVRFADGHIGEVQLWDPSMAEAKFGKGTELYDSVRSISAEDIAADPALAARVLAAEEASKDLYANALAKGSPEWRRTAMLILPEDMRVRVQAAVDSGGSTGAPGKASKKLARAISDPDSKISTGEARDQDVDPRATKKPSEPPAEVSRITAGRASQLKNLSAIDAAPRPIVRSVDDTLSPAPDATRTGTIPDTEYDAVMDQINDLIDERGELARVSREVNGELETRSLAAELESLDALEDTLERIRICSFTPRNAA